MKEQKPMDQWPTKESWWQSQRWKRETAHWIYFPVLRLVYKSCKQSKFDWVNMRHMVWNFYEFTIKHANNLPSYLQSLREVSSWKFLCKTHNNMSLKC